MLFYEGIDDMQLAIGTSHVHTNHENTALADIRDIKIDTALPLQERMKSYIRQIKNPYHYKCGDITVRVSFADTDTTLEDRITRLLLAPCAS